MDYGKTGLQTHLTRVEAWELDYNGHWNTRFYVRSFQQASEAVAPCLGEPGDEPRRARQWHMRFHHELRSTSSVVVRSAQVRGGDHHGAIVHILIGDGEVSATCLEIGTRGSELALPAVDADDIALALPRSITEPVNWDWAPDGETVPSLVGTVRPSETDHAGRLLLEHMVRCWAQGSHEFFAALGFTPEFTERTGIGRILVEIRLTWFDNCRAGDQMGVLSRLGPVGQKSFEIIHLLQPVAGSPTAVVEQVALAVDLRTRRSTDVPDFLG
jgi:acyl-CoA thioesterase FadM